MSSKIDQQDRETAKDVVRQLSKQMNRLISLRTLMVSDTCPANEAYHSIEQAIYGLCEAADIDETEMEKLMET